MRSMGQTLTARSLEKGGTDPEAPWSSHDDMGPPVKLTRLPLHVHAADHHRILDQCMFAYLGTGIIIVINTRFITIIIVIVIVLRTEVRRLGVHLDHLKIGR
jgi:hypothetical protein